MGKFEEYDISLINFTDIYRVEYVLDKTFFKKVDSEDIKNGNVRAVVTVKKVGNSYKLQFEVEGTVTISCDRCLDDMEQTIRHREQLEVEFGDTFTEKNGVLIVPENKLNVAWFLYEFVVLGIPMRHIHPSGSCNTKMMEKLKYHTHHIKDEDDEHTDQHRNHFTMNDGLTEIE